MMPQYGNGSPDYVGLVDPDDRYDHGFWSFADDDPDMGEVSARFAAAGFLVFPLHTPGATRRCDCRRDCGRNNGKHPRTARGLVDATMISTAIRRYWDMWPQANIGVRTGTPGGAIVLDIDGEIGQASVEALEARYGDLPATWAVDTGGGGLHLWYATPAASVRNSAGTKLGPGIDVRGEGGYVVAPPSLHRSGKRYDWASAWHPSRVALADPPTWLIQLVAEPAARRGTAPLGIGAPILDGARNATLTSLAGTMRRRGFTEAAIVAALRVENAARCTPPLPEPEVEKIARSIARYRPAGAEPRHWTPRPSGGVDPGHPSRRMLRTREVGHA